MKNKALIILSLTLLVSLFGCTQLYHWNEPKQPETQYSPVYPLSGEWYVTYKFDDGSGTIDDYYGVGQVLLDSYNTSSNATDSIWFTDYTGYGNYSFWYYAVKTKCDVANLTFGSTDSATNAVPGYDIKVILKNGKVLKNAVTLPSGVKADSIYFEIEYGDNPGTIYYCSGFRRTGFVEDEPVTD